MTASINAALRSKRVVTNYLCSLDLELGSSAREILERQRAGFERPSPQTAQDRTGNNCRMSGSRENGVEFCKRNADRDCATCLIKSTEVGTSHDGVGGAAVKVPHRGAVFVAGRASRIGAGLHEELIAIVRETFGI